MVGRIMRYDNDVKAERRGIREQVTNFVRTHLTKPRYAAVLGLVAVVGTGAIALSAAAQRADATPRTTAAAAVHTTAGKPVAKSVTAGKAGKTAKKTASKRSPRKVAASKEL